MLDASPVVLPTMAAPAADPYFGVPPPWLYSVQELGLPLYDWQADAQDAIGRRMPVAICAANETGKTTMIAAPVIIWFLDFFGKAGGKVVLTSGSWLQVHSQLAPAVRRQGRKLNSWDFLESEAKMKGRKDPQLIMFSTDQPGRAEGHHALDPLAAPLLYIIDEAKSVSNGIFEAVDRCNPQYCLVMSSPGQSSGRFYDCFHRLRKHYATFRVKSSECPHISEAKRAADREKYGEGHPVYLSMHEAEFMEGEEYGVFKAAALRALFEKPPMYFPGGRYAFCDFAAGGAENVLAVREGNRVWLAACWRQADTMQAVRRFIRLFEENNLFPSQIFADEGGMGIVMCDALADEGWPVVRVNNGSQPDDKVYANRGAEIWFRAARAVERREVIMPDDPVLFEQLTARRAEVKTGGKLALEPKEAMAARGLPSPDRADAVCGAIACGMFNAGALTRDGLAGVRMGEPIRI